MPEAVAAPAAESSAPAISSVNELLSMPDDAYNEKFGIVESAGEVEEQAPEPATETPKPKAETPAKVAQEAKTDDEAPPDQTDAQTGYYKDNAGKWHKENGEFATADEAEAAEQLLNPQAETPKSDEPKSDTPKPLWGGRKLATDFGIKAADGTDAGDIPEIEVSFKANGKEHTMALDKAIRLAQMGVYNEERQVEVQQARHSVGAMKQELETTKSQLQQYDTNVERLLLDPAYYESVKQEYARQNSPEVRLQQREQEFARKEQETRAQQAWQQGQQFIQQSVNPLLADSLAKHPTVSIEEAIGKLGTMIGDITQYGVVPPVFLPELKARIENGLIPWIEQLHDGRAARETATQQNTRKLVEAERVKAQILKNRAARRGMPQGQAGALREAPKPVALKRADDLANAMFGPAPD